MHVGHASVTFNIIKREPRSTKGGRLQLEVIFKQICPILHGHITSTPPPLLYLQLL